MSTQRAFPTPDPAFPPSHHQVVPATKPRRRRFVAVVSILFLLSLVMSAGVLLLCPPVLEAMSAMVLQPQPGAVPWNGHDRITVVAMGLTQRTTEPARTDTLLVMDIDPPHHKINMLSVPRDLWVDIPGNGKGKLATTYEVGGAKLAAYTLEKDLGIPVDYTVAMTFRGFITLIDAMGGVDVSVPQELKDPTYPCLTGYDYCPIDIKPGMQHMDGATALEFVRERHAFVQQDLARVQDQQAFSEAVKRRIISPFTWPRYPALLNALKNTLITNIPLNALPELGAQFILTRVGGVNHSYINMENGMVKPSWSDDGQSILVPTNTTSIPNLIHRLFDDPNVMQENASVAVLNGSSSPGAAGNEEATLQGLGFHTVMAGNADTAAYTRSQVIVNTAVRGPADYTARRLQRILNADLLKRAIPGQSAQIVVIVGSDAVAG